MSIKVDYSANFQMGPWRMSYLRMILYCLITTFVVAPLTLVIAAFAPTPPPPLPKFLNETLLCMHGLHKLNR